MNQTTTSPVEETFSQTTLIEDDKITDSSVNIDAFIKSLLVAGLSAANAEFITFPIDTTKVYLQLINKRHDIHHNNHCVHNYNSVNNEYRNYLDIANSNHSQLENQNKKYLDHKPPISTFRVPVLLNYYRSMCEIYRNNGITGFYRGYKPAVLRASFNNALSATFYKQIRSSIFGCNTRDCPLYVKCIAGFTTGTCSQILAAPTDLLKVRLQADSMRSVPRYNGLLDAVEKIYKKHGFCAFYRGLIPSIGRAGFSVAATFGTYDHCKAYMLRVMQWEDNIKTHAVSSAWSGLIATLVSCPFDVVKTRYQSQSISNPLYKSPRQCFGTITKQEGISVLYRGFGPMYFRLAPWQLSFFIVFEFLSKHVLGESF